MDQRHYLEVTEELDGNPVRIITYQIGSRHHCHIENIDPGAVIARASADTLEEANRTAIAKAKRRLAV